MIYVFGVFTVVHIIRIDCSIGGTRDYDILLGIHSHLIHFITQFQHLVSLDALLLSLLRDLEAEHVSLGVEVPSRGSSPEGHHGSIDDIVIQFPVRLEILRHIRFLLGEFL